MTYVPPPTVQNNVGNQLILGLATTDPSTLTGASTGAMVLGLKDVSWDRDAGLQDATTQLSGGFYQSAPTVKKLSGTAAGMAILGVPLTLVEGTAYSFSLTQTHGVSTYGVLRVGKIHEQYVDPAALANYTFDFVSEGAYTNTAAA